MDENLSDVFQSSSRNQYKIKTVERIMKRTIQVLRVHLKNSQFEPDRFELSFGKNKKLKEAEVPLEDGRKKFELEDFYYGLEMQLVIYMNAAEEIYKENEQNPDNKPVVPAGIFYYQLQDPIIKADYA